MTEKELTQEILDYIRTLYNADYVGYIKVLKEDGIYSLALGIPSWMTRTNIAIATDSDEEFLTYIKEELRTRNYMRLMIYRVDRTYEKREE